MLVEAPAFYLHSIIMFYSFKITDVEVCLCQEVQVVCIKRVCTGIIYSVVAFMKFLNKLEQPYPVSNV
jgi:hypothetical protein